MYPTTSPRGTISKTIATTSNAAPEIPVEPITIASAYPPEAMEYLGMLYYSRLTGIFPENSQAWIGDSVNLGELAQFRDSFRIEAFQVEPSGVSEERLRVWAAANQLPDIYLTNRLALCAVNGWAADLSTTAGTHRALAQDNFYLSMLEGAKSGARLFGIPVSFTTPILVCNRKSTQSLGIQLPENDVWDFAQFAQAMAALSTPTAPDTPQQLTPSTLVSLSSPRPQFALVGLLELLPASLDVTLGWAAWTGTRFAFEQEAFLAATQHVQMLATEATAWTQPPAKDTEIICLVDSSAVPQERKRLGEQIGICRIPVLGATERVGARIQTFCLSPDAGDSQLRVDFALFVALDPDALLLGARFIQHEGYLPLSREPRVWEQTVMTWPSATFFDAMKPLFADAFIDGWSCVPGWDLVVSGKLRVAEQKILQGLKTAEEMVEWLNASPGFEREG